MTASVVVDYEVHVKRYTHEGQVKTPNYRLSSIKSALSEGNAASKALGEAEDWMQHPWTLAAKVVEHKYGPGIEAKRTVAEYRRV